jgi:hypothetical protein
LSRCCSGADGTSRLSNGYSLHTRTTTAGHQQHNTGLSQCVHARCKFHKQQTGKQQLGDPH